MAIFSPPPLRTASRSSPASILPSAQSSFRMDRLRATPPSDCAVTQIGNGCQPRWHHRSAPTVPVIGGEVPLLASPGGEVLRMLGPSRSM